MYDIFSQVLLHDPAEVPQMKDLGYAISTGSHTLLATKYTKVTYLVSLLTIYRLPNISKLRFLKKKVKRRFQLLRVLKICLFLGIYLPDCSDVHRIVLFALWTERV